MQFPVPQFLDVEDKIFGPFSLKQFGFVFFGGLIVVAIYRIFGIGFVFIILGLPIAIFTLFMTFGSFNGKKVYNVIPVFLNYISMPKRMIFHKTAHLDGLDVKPMTMEQYKEITGANAAKEVIVEAPQTRLQEVTHLLQQKNAEEQEIINKQNSL